MSIWLGENFRDYLTGEFNMNIWLGENLMSFFDGVFDFGDWIKINIKDFITGNISFIDMIKSIFGGSFFGGGEARGGKGFTGEFQNGTDFVPETGLALLHKGEKVVPAGRSIGRTTILKPTFNFNGPINKDIDVDSLMKRASRRVELDLRRFSSSG